MLKYILMNKKLFLLSLIILFIPAVLIIYYRSTFYNILDIKTPSCFVIDFNHNNAPDAGEEIIIDGIQILQNKLDNLTDKEEFIFRELAKNYTKDLFFNKKVRYTKRDLYVDGKSYIKEFDASGFNYEKAPEEYKKLVKYIRENEFYIVNLHNLRAHKYGCPYSLKSENYEVFEETKLPAKSVFCKLCCCKDVTEQAEMLTPPMDGAGSIKILYTDFTTKLKPDKTCSTTVCRELLTRINNAKTSIDMAVYGYRSIPQIEEALKTAIARGVKIRMVYDLDRKGESVYEDTVQLADMIQDSVNDFESQKFVKNSYGNVIMHNKFYIFDDMFVYTGSANLSPSDMSGFNTNTAVVIESPEIAAIYKKEFEQMYVNKFHTQKDALINNINIQLQDSIVSVYFSPQDKITTKRILPLIKEAKKYIYIPAFLITDKGLADELISAKKRGVDVKIILDALNARSKYSQIKYLRSNGIEVKAENYAGKLHCKTILIDDEITIIGSMNFSKSGQDINDENVLIIRNKDITSEYREFFEYLWKKIDDWWLMYIPRAESEESIGSCTDGVDNNYDGMIDGADAGCKLN